MNKDIMSYCGDDILDEADKNWNKAGNKPALKRLTVIAAAALLTAGLIAAAVITASKLNEMLPPVVPGTSAVIVTDADQTEATTSANTAESAIVIPPESDICGDETSAPTETKESAETGREGITTAAEETDSGKMTTAGVIEIPTKTIIDYGEYRSFLDETEGGVNIIDYDALKDIGDFKSFILLSDDFSEYRYLFDDGSGFTVNLTVTDISVHESANGYETLSTSENDSDMRLLSDNYDGIRYIDDIEYMYVEGRLLWVCFRDGDMEYLFSGDSMLDGYPKNADTFMSKLLTAETAADCINTLKADLKGGNK